MFTIIIIWSVTFFFFFLFGHAMWHLGSWFLTTSIKPMPLQWKHGILITGTPGNSLISDLFSLHQIPYLLLKISLNDNSCISKFVSQFSAWKSTFLLDYLKSPSRSGDLSSPLLPVYPFQPTWEGTQFIYS